MIDHSLSVDEYRAPWTPKVGDRVRVRLSAECDMPTGDESFARRRGIERGHDARWDGMAAGVAVIYWPGHRLYEAGHPYGVVFDEPGVIGGVEVQGEVLSLTELEPVDGAS